jgi:hypothetical protein
MINIFVTYFLIFVLKTVYLNQFDMVDVAQLVEHQIVALVVMGSIPIIHPILRQGFVWRSQQKT